MNNISKLKVGDTVLWRGGWGRDVAKEAVVKAISINCNGGKEGDLVPAIDWYLVHKEGFVVVDVNTNWAYGYQIDPLWTKNSTTKIKK